MGLFFAVAGVLVLLGAFVQINPVWQYGQYVVANGTNGVQPDWYMGWLIGALRLMPPFEPTLFGRTIPNPFFGGALFPLIAFGILYAWPWLERAFSDDREPHHLLQRPRDNPVRSAFGAALFTWVAVPFFAGSADRVFVTFDVSYQNQVQVLRVAWLVLPVIAFLVTLHICRRLRGSGEHPLREWSGSVVERNAAGGFDARRESGS